MFHGRVTAHGPGKGRLWLKSYSRRGGRTLKANINKIGKLISLEIGVLYCKLTDKCFPFLFRKSGFFSQRHWYINFYHDCFTIIIVMVERQIVVIIRYFLKKTKRIILLIIVGKRFSFFTENSDNWQFTLPKKMWEFSIGCIVLSYSTVHMLKI